MGGKYWTETEKDFLKKNFQKMYLINMADLPLFKGKRTYASLRHMAVKLKLRRNWFNENHPAWKGDNASYRALHTWIVNRVNRPKKCPECNSNEFIEICNISGKYLRKISDWKYLCRRCHMKSDGRLVRLGINPKIPIKKFTKEGVFIKNYDSIIEASKKNKIRREAISMAINNQRKSAGGFIWRKENG